MTTTWHHVIMENEGMFVAFFICGISMKSISNHLLGDLNIVFVVHLGPNGMFIYVHVISVISSPFEVVDDIIQKLCILEQSLMYTWHVGMGTGLIQGNNNCNYLHLCTPFSNFFIK